MVKTEQSFSIDAKVAIPPDTSSESLSMSFGPTSELSDMRSEGSTIYLKTKKSGQITFNLTIQETTNFNKLSKGITVTVDPADLKTLNNCIQIANGQITEHGADYEMTDDDFNNDTKYIHDESWTTFISDYKKAIEVKKSDPFEEDVDSAYSALIISMAAIRLKEKG